MLVTDRIYNWVAISISVLALIISGLALYISWSQYDIDYDTAVLIKPGTLPIVQIKEGMNDFSLDISNTSKSNLQYFLRADTNMGCVDGEHSRPQIVPCRYESQVVSLSKIDAGNSGYRHIIRLDARNGAVETNPLAYASEPDYYMDIEIVDAANGKLLYKSECFYSYQIDAKVFALDQPVMDTSGESIEKQKLCR